jgi:hypothetical protein
MTMKWRVTQTTRTRKYLEKPIEKNKVVAKNVTKSYI